MATKTPMSLEAFLELEPCAPELELMDGEVVQKAMVGKAHSRLVRKLLQALANYGDEIGTIDVDTELRHLHREAQWVFIPDVSVTFQDRLAGYSFSENRPVEVLPDFAIEVLSPDDRPGRVTQKIAHYMQAGVPLLWVVDPEERQITVWRPDAAPHNVETSETLTAAPVLPDFSADLGELFAAADV